MIDQPGLTILCGGLYRCTPAWDKPADEMDQCYKFYFPVRGEAFYVIDGQPRAFRPGAFYLFSGFHVQRQYCPESCEVYWLHFVPDSLYLSHLLARIPPLMQWEAQPQAHWEPCIRRARELFDHPERQTNTLRTSGLDPRLFQIQAMLLYFISDFLLRHKPLLEEGEAPLFQAMRPAIAYMDQEYANNPNLDQIARQVHLAPKYFQRKFATAFQITPHEYLTRKRMNKARELLLNSLLSIKEIALQLGYNNQFYFSRAFRRHFGCNPLQFRGNSRHL